MSAPRLLLVVLALIHSASALALPGDLPFPGREQPGGGGGVNRCEDQDPVNDCGNGVCPVGYDCRQVSGQICTCMETAPRPDDDDDCFLRLGETHEATYVPRWTLPGFTFDIFNLGPASAPLTPGNALHFVSSNSMLAPVRHGQSWGGGFQTISIPNQAITVQIQLTQYDPIWPQMLHFNVTSLSSTIPSFASVALDGGQTGANVITLCQHSPYAGHSYGWIDTTNGGVALYLIADLANDQFTTGIISALLFADVTGATVTVRRDDPDVMMWASANHH